LLQQSRRIVVNKIRFALLFLVVLVMGSGCYYYPPPAYTVVSPPHASYDRIWDSAMRAAQDVGIRITSSDRNAGTASGQRDGVGVTIQVVKQSDGTTRVEITSKGGPSTVTDDFYKAYNRNMGR
jgi:hypothetical protein